MIQDGFGEDQARYLLACKDSEAVISAAKLAGVAAELVGSFGGSNIYLGEAIIDIDTVKKHSKQHYDP